MWLLRGGEPRGPKVLRRVRSTARTRVFLVRLAESAIREVLVANWWNGAHSVDPLFQPERNRRLPSPSDGWSLSCSPISSGTTASEDRDPEETRELLSAYFETARTLVERYGGTVERERGRGRLH